MKQINRETFFKTSFNYHQKYYFAKQSGFFCLIVEKGKEESRSSILKNNIRFRMNFSQVKNNKFMKSVFFLKQQIKIPMPKNVEDVDWLFPTFDNSFVTISKPGRLNYINSQSQTICTKLFESPIIRAEMLSSDLVLVLFSDSLFLIDLPKRQVKKVIKQTTYPEQNIFLKELFTFRGMLFCIVLNNQKKETSTIAYFSGKDVLTKQKINPIALYTTSSLIQYNAIHKANNKSMVTWFKSIDYDYTYFDAYQLTEQGTGLYSKHSIRFGQIQIKNKLLDVGFKPSTFKMVQLTQDQFLVFYPHFLGKQDHFQRSPLSQFFYYKVKDKYKNLQSVSSQKNILNAFPSTIRVFSIQNIPHVFILANTVYPFKKERKYSSFYHLFEKQTNSFIQYWGPSFNTQKKQSFCISNDQSESQYEWSSQQQKDGQISVNIKFWNWFTLKQIYMFLMQQALDLDECLISDVLKLLFQNI